MHIQSHAFPMTYLSAICTKHECVVTVNYIGATNPRTRTTTGVQVGAVSCEKGGAPDARRESCEAHWQMTISTPGGISLPAQ